MRRARLTIEWMETEDKKTDGWQVRVPANGDDPEATIPLKSWDLKFTTEDGGGMRFQGPAKARK